MLDQLDKFSSGRDSTTLKELANCFHSSDEEECQDFQEAKMLLDNAQTLINEMRLSNKQDSARKMQVVYQEQCMKVQKLAKDYECLYKRFVVKDTHERVSETLLKGGVFKVDGSDSEDEKFNSNIQDIQMNQQMTLEQRRLKVEAETTKYMIEHRKAGLNSVTNLMTGVRDLGFEFNKEVENQGARLEEVGNNVDDYNQNTHKGTQELNTFAQTMRGKGIQLLICLGVLVLILLFLIYLIVW